ncbi:hypothetical protein AAJ76_7000015806 [Vairimorpha ceranae]|uniref:Uncharacterized protein n=1 Tax=Vairimorpha ceranae TaxID=40302 RepID=A0A0F9Z9F0_9MICR|nr:hypothetical protein AAJ76_7000015806 [Vairimorpha ceranae]KKO74454.1 hypothetical protein AAJ76_7000015806 [Vairimorpha ceranae]
MLSIMNWYILSICLVFTAVFIFALFKSHSNALTKISLKNYVSD